MVGIVSRWKAWDGGGCEVGEWAYHCEWVGGACWTTGVWFGLVVLFMRVCWVEAVVLLLARGCVVLACGCLMMFQQLVVARVGVHRQRG
jgi:hypothetical protein